MPVFNGEEHINEAIESVLNQTYKNLELIIINDGSNDNTSKILEVYKNKDSRITVITNSEASGGPALPRNIGMKFSNGSFLAFIDHDDIWHHKKLEIQLKTLTDLNVCFISSERIDIKRSQKDLDYNNIDLHNKNYLKINSHQLLGNNLINTSSVVINKKIVKTEKFNENKKYISVEDFIMWVELHRKIDYSLKMEIPLIRYRLTKSSLSSNKLRMVKRRWSALGILVEDSITLKTKYIILYILSYFMKSYFNKFSFT